MVRLCALIIRTFAFMPQENALSHEYLFGDGKYIRSIYTKGKRALRFFRGRLVVNRKIVNERSLSALNLA